MTDDQIIETAMHVHASKRDAIRWAMKQVRMQANTHKSDAVVRQLVEALDETLTAYRELMNEQGIVGASIADVAQDAQAALAAAKGA